MKTKIIPKLLSSLLALTLCLAACQDEAPTDETGGQAQESAHTTDSSPSTGGATANTDSAVLPDVELCWTCEELPAVDGSIYCVNCKCLICAAPRKPGNGYLYCGSHNCNETLCKSPAVESDDSQYCTAHKCIISGCRNEKQQTSEYCYVHRDR